MDVIGVGVRPDLQCFNERLAASLFVTLSRVYFGGHQFCVTVGRENFEESLKVLP